MGFAFGGLFDLWWIFDFWVLVGFILLLVVYACNLLVLFVFGFYSLVFLHEISSVWVVASQKLVGFGLSEDVFV